MSENKGSESKRWKVLSVRVPQDLLDGLEVLRVQWVQENKGMSCSREDIVRGILWEAIGNEDSY